MNPPIKQITFNSVLIIENDEVEIFIAKRVIQAVQFAKDIIVRSTTKDAADHLKMQTGETLPEIIFLDFKIIDREGLPFLDEFSRLYELVGKKCKIVLLMNEDPNDYKISGKLSNNSLKYSLIQKPLTLEALRKFDV